MWWNGNRCLTKDTVLKPKYRKYPTSGSPKFQLPLMSRFAPKPKPSITYPSRANKQKLREKDDNLASKFVEIFRELHFELSFADALLHMPKFASMFKSLLNNKEKLFDLAKTPINLLPLSIWKKLLLPELTPTQMILELADRSTTSPSGIDDDDFDPEGDLLLLKKLLNDDPSSLLPPKELHVEELKIVKSSIDDPPELELKDLPSYLECMMAIFHDMIEETMEVFMDDFSVFGDSFSSCLSHLDKMLKRCEDTNLVLNWEKCHFMVKEGIVLGHKISKSEIEVDKAKVDVIAKLPHPTSVKGIRSFLVHAGFYRRFIQDFSKIARPMTHLLEKDTPFIFSKECVESFNILKKKLTEAPILVAPD
ncbi:reverse transcriptase domain-containing protein [Tanacetum coccineum]